MHPSIPKNSIFERANIHFPEHLNVVEKQPKKIVGNQRLFRIMDRVAGDVKVMWDRTKKIEVDAMRKLFADLRAKGYAAYTVDDDTGNKGNVVREFDPDAERFIMIPPMAGG
jgi:hypothetical protein